MFTATEGFTGVPIVLLGHCRDCGALMCNTQSWNLVKMT